MRYRFRAQFAMVAIGSLLASSLLAQTIQQPFSDAYSYTDLGYPAGVPTRLGGVNFALGDPNRLIVGGLANSIDAGIYSIALTRDSSGRITGFSGVATRIAAAPYQDGGLAYGPGNVLFQSEYPVNKLGELKSGSTALDAVIDLNALGVQSSQGAVNFVPGGFGGAGRMKLVSWPGGQWYDAQIAPTGSGTYNITTLTVKPASQLNGGPEGFFYVPTLSPHFSTPSMLVSEYSAGTIDAYQVDSNGDPIVASRQIFMDGLSGAEGAVFDPVSGDYVFTTYGNGDRIIVIHGFVQSLPGDFNLDGAVNAADYVTWRQGLGSTFTQADYDVWRSHFGQTAGSGAGAIANAAVPEPATLVLLVFSSASWFLRRRRAV